MNRPRQLGVVAAGHPKSAEFGAAALRAGGNAVDAAIGALLASLTCEPVLTGLGAGGYMLVVEPGGEAVVLDFFVDAPGRGLSMALREAARMDAVEVSFGDAVQRFFGGPASACAYGVPAGVVDANRRFGRLPLAELTAPAARLARDGAPLAPEQAHICEIVAGLLTLTPEVAALFAPDGRLLRAGEVYRDPALGDSLELLGTAGAAPFYTGEIAGRVVDWLGERGGLLTAADLAAYAVRTSEPVHLRFRGREVLTNPPSSAGGVLIAQALLELDRAAAPAGPAAVLAAMEHAQSLRTPEFMEELNSPGFVERFMHGGAGGGGGGGGSQPGGQPSGARTLGSTTHVAAIDADGLACSMTTSNGSSSGVAIPGTGIHINNMLGELDLNPGGSARHPAGRRLPSMMSPTAVLRDGRPELVLGSAGSNRIRSAILQTIIRVVDDGQTAAEAVLAPRLHYEDGVVYAEPGIDPAALGETRHELVTFAGRNLFFGGVQAVQVDADGCLWGGGDPRRGGAAVVVTG